MSPETEPFSRARPVFDRRAYMLDISRDRVPTLATLEWLVSVLQRLRFNELQLYTEHTFTYTGHDEVWRDASPMTHDDMRWIDRMCADHGVELVANMNCFGHMERWLEHDQYRPLAETPDGAKGLWGEGLMPPGCLAATPENAAFGLELAHEMAGVVRSRRIHIGGDEPFELGEGKSAAAVAESGRDHVYLRHLNRIIEPLVDAGHEVMFWADLFRRDPSLMPLIPNGTVGVVWNYEAPGGESWTDLMGPEMAERLGIPDDAALGFASHARQFIDTGRSFWVAPGTASWCTLIGRNINAAGNIADAVAVGAASGSPGLLLTDWGDQGHMQPLPVSLPALVRAGVGAWDGLVPSAASVAGLIDDALGCAPGVGSLLDRLGEVGEGLGLSCINSTPIFGSLRGAGMPAIGEIDGDGLGRAREVMTEATEVFASGADAGPRGATTAAEMNAAVGLAAVGLQRLAVDHGIEGDKPDDQELDRAITAQRSAWLLSSRPGGRDDSIGKIGR